MAELEVGDGWRELAQADAAGSSEGGAAAAGGASNRPPQAAAVCVATAEDAAVEVPVLDYVRDPNGDPLQLLSASDPSSGEVSLNPDGTVAFTPREPGLQSFQYQVGDGQGGAASGAVSVLVNPQDGELDRPVLAGLGNQQLVELARACAAGTALDVVRLEGAQVEVRPPEAGTRVQVQTEPGQAIELAGGAFASATYIVVEGGLLVVTEDGRLVYLSGFVDSAESGPPPTLAVAGGPAVAASELLANLQPITEPAEGPVVGWLPPPPPGGGPAHGGGAGFSPYDPGDIGPGLGLTGPLLPTALGPGREFLIRGTGEFGNGEQAGAPGGEPGPGPNPGPGPGPEPGPGPGPGPSPGPGPGPGPGPNARPQLTISGEVTAEVGEVTRPIDFVSAPPFPTLVEQGAVDLDLVNGVDPRNLVLGPNADATITFRDEIAAFDNSLGVVLVGPDGTLGPARIVFAQVEHADAIPEFPFARPGGGPLSPGDEVRLSELYTSGELTEGQQFAFFTIVEGFRFNGDLTGAELVFLNDDGSPASLGDPAPGVFALLPDGTLVPLAGNVFHTATPTVDDPLGNALNDGGRGQVLSGLEDGTAGLSITFEDKRLNFGDTESDNDFNDVTYEVLLEPSTGSSLDFVDLRVAVDATVADDDPNLSGAVVRISSGQQAGDALLVGIPLDGTGITVVEDGLPGRLVLAGEAPVATYVDVLRSIELDAATEGLREITFRVTDERGAESAPATVRVDLTTAGAEFGGPGDDILLGEPGVNDAIAGRRGDDQLFGLSGHDVLDGGLGDDQLFGDDTLPAASDGDDVLIGGPGADLLVGGGGADAHVYFTLTERGDTIRGFDATEGDTLDFSGLFQGSGVDPGAVDPFVRFDAAGGDVVVSVDKDGAGSDFAFIAMATLTDPTGVTTAQAAADNGSLVVA